MPFECMCACHLQKKSFPHIFEALRKLWSNWGQRFQLMVFLLLGLIFATLHHILGNSLSGKPATHNYLLGRWNIPSQSVVSAASNVLSQIVKWLLTSTIGVAFAQYFWSATKAKIYQDWRNLDAPLAAANGNPFTFTAFPTWWRSPGLAFSALMTLSMIFIPIFVPGSIRVVTAGFTQPCTIYIPDISKVSSITATMTILKNPYSHPQVRTLPIDTQTTTLINRIIVGSSYLPAFNSCDGGVCTYQINFTAPSLKCSSDTNVTTSDNFPLYSEQDNLNVIPLLNSTFNESELALTVASRGGVLPEETNPPLGVRCYGYATNYHVRVQHDSKFSSHIDIINVTVGSRLVPSNDPEEELLGFFVALSQAISGTVIFDSHTNGFTGTPLSVVYYSPMMQCGSTGGNRVSWSDLTTTLPDLMQNVSLSLLSGQFPSNYQETYMTKVQTNCEMTKVVYGYNSDRLLAIYAVAWGAATIFLSFGFWFVKKNEVEHTLDFSHVVIHWWRRNEQTPLGFLARYSEVRLQPED